MALQNGQLRLFDAAIAPSNPRWRPQEPPDLSGEEDIFLDCETTGLRWWRGDHPVGLAVATKDCRSWYLPFGHAGGNLDEATVLRWAREQLSNKKIHFLNAPFDIHNMYVWGVDLEAQGCTVTDIGHWAALLDEKRSSNSLDDVAKDYLGRGKLGGIDVRRMAEYHACDVVSYACCDVILLAELREVLGPKIDAEGLGQVLQLEDECIYVTCEMERNGAPLDVEKLEAWVRRSEQEYIECVWQIHKLTGVEVNPNSRDDLQLLFRKCGIPAPTAVDEYDGKVKVCFKKDLLKSIDHPAIHQAYKARRLSSLRSKYLLKYQKEVGRNGRVIYHLHQMPVERGTGVKFGRYSCSSYNTDPDEGVNIQQVAGKKQMASVQGDEDLEGYVVRELYIPGSGLYLVADAEQIEFRLFAHYAKPARVLAEYEKNPHTNFHRVVNSMIAEAGAQVTYERTKDGNFAKLYGAGLEQTASTLGISEAEAQTFIRIYDRAFPEAKALIRRASMLAEERGYVKTILGRKARFAALDDFYTALNRVIQGGAADIMKRKLVELHKARKKTGFKLRFPVHDQVNGDVPDRKAALMVREILDTQSFHTIVPILWDVKIGPNWKDCQALGEAA